MSTLIFLLSFPISIAYFFNPHFLSKAGVIWALALFSYLQKTKYSNMITIGLIFSSFGDIFLEILDHYNIDLFIPGLVSFLLAHIAYIIGFKLPIESSSLTFLPLLALYYVGIMSLLVPRIESDLRIPVLIYGLAICTMGFMSINRFMNITLNDSGFYSLLGSISFIISDTILAVNKFYTPIGDAKNYIMITYYIGQMLIAYSTKADDSKVIKKE